MIGVENEYEEEMDEEFMDCIEPAGHPGGHHNRGYGPTG